MNKQFKTLVFVAVASSMMLMAAGCYGSFNLTKKVYQWNGSMSDKWVKELVFLGLNVIPVYEVSAGIDAIILNSIEFWTGSNPVAFNANSENGTTLTFNTEKKELSISYDTKHYIVGLENGKAAVKDEEGMVIAYCVSTADGGMTITDAKGAALSQYSKEQVSEILAAR
jgi:hypothetical protein